MFDRSDEIISLTKKYVTHSYEPIPVVVTEAKGVWIKDLEGKEYLDMIGSGSAMTCGHRHQRIINALKKQADQVTLTSRLIYNDQLVPYSKKLTKMTGKDMILPMNTGTDAAEAAIKCARRWAYNIKNVPKNEAEIIVCARSFHGSTITTVSSSTNEECFKGFGPFTPGFNIIPFGDADALKKSISANTAAFLVEPIQGHAGIIIPPAGFLKEAFLCCQENNILFIADEVITGLGRTGKLFACDWENVEPDIYILGKPLSGGVLPVSAVVANFEILGIFDPGSNPSTFGGNPLACACAKATLEVIETENLPRRADELGRYFLNKLSRIENPDIKEVRGKGLLLAIEFCSSAKSYSDELRKEGLLVSQVAENILRFIPPLIITKKELDWALKKIVKVIGKE